MQAFIPIVITIICRAVFLISFSYDRSRYRNCPLLFIAILSLAPAAYVLAGDRAFVPAAVVLAVLILAFLAVPAILIANGILMYKREETPSFLYRRLDSVHTAGYCDCPVHRIKSGLR